MSAILNDHKELGITDVRSADVVESLLEVSVSKSVKMLTVELDSMTTASHSANKMNRKPR